MELMLWQWSTAVQVVSCLMVAAFFTVFARRVRSVEVLAWRNAWLLNVGALVVTAGFWLIDWGGFWSPFITAFYFGTKLLFVVGVVEGAWWVARPDQPSPFRLWLRWVVAAYAVVGGVVAVSIPEIGVIGSLGLTLLLLPTGLWVMGTRAAGFRWLGVGLLLRGLVATVEGVAYASQLDAFGALSPSVGASAALFLAASSSFDSGAEWLLALGCVLVSMQRSRAEIERSNQQLLAAQSELRSLADRDPLTGLLNRRALDEALKEARGVGATIAFFDLDDFKQVNDVQGHEVGDAVLVTFARALREAFRPEDAVIRYAGDEFVVVARALTVAGMERRIEKLRAYAGASRFSHGVSELPPGGDPEAAMREADATMYSMKQVAGDRDRGAPRPPNAPRAGRG